MDLGTVLGDDLEVDDLRPVNVGLGLVRHCWPDVGIECTVSASRPPLLVWRKATALALGCHRCRSELAVEKLGLGDAILGAPLETHNVRDS